MRFAHIILTIAMLAAPISSAEVQSSTLIGAQVVDGKLVLASKLRSDGLVEAFVIPMVMVTLQVEDAGRGVVVIMGSQGRQFTGEDVAKLRSLLVPKPNELTPEIKKALGLQ